MHLIIFLFTSLAFAAGPENKPQKIPPLKKAEACPSLDLFAAVKTQRGADCLSQAAHYMDVNETNQNGDTPLHYAIRHRNKAALFYLLKHGADLNRRNNQLQTPRELAAAYGYRRLTELLSNTELETERLLTALEAGDLAAANASLLRGASVSTTNSRFDTPLHRAAQSNLPEMATLLLRYGAALNARNYLGETPLHSAALRDFYEVIKVLVEAGADLSLLNERRETVLDLALVHEHPGILALLKKKHARRGSRADVDLAISGGDGEIVREGT